MAESSITDTRPAQRLPLLLGMPDDMQVNLHAINPDGTWAFKIPGNAHFLPYLEERDRTRFQLVHFGPRLKTNFKCPSGSAIVNNIADADTSGQSLRMLEKLVADSGSACFNHPSAVLDSGRDSVARKLSSIAGLKVPRTIRTRLSDPGDLDAILKEADIAFPVLLRIAGVHGGSTTLKIDDADAIRPGLRSIPWGGRELYITEYFPYRDDDGYHRKMRLVIVGREVLLRHLVVADTWHVHVDAREASSLQEESDALASFDHNLLPLVRERALAIADALDLDYFGIDCILRPDGDLLVFEANAAMAILLNSSPSPNIWEAPIGRIRHALVDLLFDVKRWRHHDRKTRTG